MDSSQAPIAPTPPPAAPEPGEQNVLTPAQAEPPRQTYLPQLVMLVVTIVGGLLVSSLPANNSGVSNNTVFFYIPSLLLIAVSIYSLVVQWRTFHTSRPMLFRLEFLLIIAAAVIPAIAALLGDFKGSADFTNASELTAGSVLFFVAILSLPALVLAASANALYIVTRFHIALKVLGIIGYGFMWVAVMVVAYFAYIIQYTVHDPNSE